MTADTRDRGFRMAVINSSRHVDIAYYSRRSHFKCPLALARFRSDSTSIKTSLQGTEQEKTKGSKKAHECKRKILQVR